MIDFTRRAAAGAAVLAFLIASPAAAQEDLDSGKTPAQLYASDCAICHKSARGLSQAGGIMGLQSFLREHYTASRQSAAIIAAYLQAIDRSPPTAAERKASGKRSPKIGEAKSNKSAKTKDEGKSSEPKLPQAKPAEAGASEVGAKPAEPKAAEAKAETPKPPAAKPAEEAKPSKPEKPDKPEKSD